jgi:hypothetical protein
MSINVREMACRPEDVFTVLADGWLFPTWVVGASRMRDVDERWPAVGSALHHSFGVWPMLIDDESVVLEYDPPRRFVLRPKGWPMGEAEVVIDVKQRGAGCVVRIEEFPVAGPGTWVPRPLLDIALYQRNIETLRRLAFIAEGKADDAPVTRGDRA